MTTLKGILMVSVLGATGVLLWVLWAPSPATRVATEPPDLPASPINHAAPEHSPARTETHTPTRREIVAESTPDPVALAVAPKRTAVAPEETRVAAAVRRVAARLGIEVVRPLRLSESEWKQLAAEYEPYRRRLAGLRADRSLIVLNKSHQLAAQGQAQTVRSETREVNEAGVVEAVGRAPQGSQVIKQYRQSEDGTSLVHVVAVPLDQVPDAAALLLEQREAEAEWFKSAQKILRTHVR